MSSLQRRLLLEQYRAPNRTVTGKQLAQLVGTKNWRQVNLHYGGLGRIFCETLKLDLEDLGGSNPDWWSVWSTGYSVRKVFLWEMLPQVAEALEVLGWVEASEPRLPEEVPSEGKLAEGAVRRVLVNAYERNREARSKCVEHYGTTCAACEIDLELIYGPIARGFIHVHHLKPLSEVGVEYEVDPVADLRPVCPNCHAVIHLGNRTRSIEEVKELLEYASSRPDL